MAEKRKPKPHSPKAHRANLGKRRSSLTRERKSASIPLWRSIGLAVFLFVIGSFLYIFYPAGNQDIAQTPDAISLESGSATDRIGNQPSSAKSAPSRYHKAGNLTLIWDPIKPQILEQLLPTSEISNIERRDYVGDSACVQCHQENHSQWSRHPHRFMNALATETTVFGDFSGNASMHYRGGLATFYQEVVLPEI
jgi:hypothetical protein